MKLLKRGIDTRAWELQYLVALEGCGKCPCCGEEDCIEITPAYKHTKNKNGCELWNDKFRCKNCDAEWESAPYFGREHFRNLQPIAERFIGLPPGM